MLIQCRECNARVSSEARTCPRCGIRGPSGKYSFKEHGISYDVDQNDRRYCGDCQKITTQKSIYMTWVNKDGQQAKVAWECKECGLTTRAEEDRLRKTQTEERERGAPARAASTHRQEARKRATVFVQYYYGYFGPWLICAIPTFFMDAGERVKAQASCVIFLPVFNWFTCLFTIAKASSVEYLIVGLLASGIATFTLWALLRAVHSSVQALLVSGAFVILTILLLRASSFTLLRNF